MSITQSVTRLNLEIVIPIDVWANEKLPDVATSIKQEIEDSGWNEGRYPFDRELMQSGLYGIIKRAVHNAVYEHFQSIVGKDAIEVLETTAGRVTCSVNKAHYLTELYMKDKQVDASVGMELWKANVTERTKDV